MRGTKTGIGVGLFFGMLSAACVVEGDDMVGDDATVTDERYALTTPTGATWIVPPRPAARTTMMFGDAYVAPFISAGWSTTATPTTAVKAEGTSSLQVNIAQAWGALGLGIDWEEECYSAASQTEVSFRFNAGATVNAGIATLAVGIDDDNEDDPIYVTLKPYLTSGTVAANTWYSVTIPMGVLNPAGKPIRRLLIANRSSRTNVPFYVDDVKLGWTDAAPTERLVYGDGPGTDFSVGGWSATWTADAFRTTGSNAVKFNQNAAWSAGQFVYDWNKPELPNGGFTTVSFDISPGPGAPPAAMNSLRVGLDTAPTKTVASFIPGGFKANTWHRVTIPVSALSSASIRSLTFKNESTASYSFYVDHVRFETDHTPPPLRGTVVVPGGDPDTFAAGEVDVVSVVRTAEERLAISPLIYGINSINAAAYPADVLAATTWMRRGGDRANAFNWETNLSNGSHYGGFANDMYLAEHLPNPNEPGALDLALVTGNRNAGRATMVPFVLNSFVAATPAGYIPFDQPNWNRAAYFNRVELVKPTPFSATPDLNDGVVYTDEHIHFLRSKFATDIFAPGPTQLMVGIDNEPDLYAYNFPFLQDGTGDELASPRNGATVGRRVTGTEFTAKFVKFAKRVKQMAPNAPIVGPDHFHFDGWTSWNASMDEYSSAGNARWYMDDYLETVRNESQAAGVRLLDTWDFHWYPQRDFNGTMVWNLDHATRPMSATEIDAVLQGPRSYWDSTFDEQSWITRDHLFGPARILTRLMPRIEAGYPGTKVGVTEYYPGGRNHVSSGLATADSLGVFARMGVHLAAMWPAGSGNQYAFGGLKLMRNADGAGTRFADTSVKVEHPEIAPSSVYAGSDGPGRVTVLVVNKTNAVRKFGLRAFHSQKLGRVDAYRIDSESPNPVQLPAATLTKNNAYAYSAPARSATLLVFRTP